LVAGEPIRFWGAGDSATPTEKEEQKAVWFLDGDQVAEGQNIFLSTPMAGEYKPSLEVSWSAQGGDAIRSFFTIYTPSGPGDTRQCKNC